MCKITKLLILSALLSGCTQTFYIGRIPQSHFSYPNSNVIPLTTVKGQSPIAVKLFLPPTVTSRIMTEAYSDALRKSQDADLIINLDAYFKSTQIPLGFITIYFSKFLVEGTSAKQEVGKKKLN